MSFLTPLFWLAIISPLFIIGWIKSKKGNPKYILYFVLYFLIDIYIQLLARQFIDLKPFGIKMAWVGKFLSLALSVGIIFSVSKQDRQEIGFSNFTDKKNLKFGILIFIAFLIFDTIFKFILFPKGGKFDLETFAFQATMPGLTEEIQFRGINLWLLSKAFLPKWKWRGVNFGWDFIIVTALFGICHGAMIDEHSHIKFELITILYLTLISSLSLGLLRKFSGNLIYSTISHNVINTINAIIRIL